MAFDHRAYVHESDKAALNALKSIPGFKQLVKGFMKIFSERQYRIVNLSSHIRISEKQFPQYYEMLPPICEKLGIEVPDLYLELNDNPNALTAGDEKPFIVMTSGLINKLPEELLPTVLAHECGHIACHHQLYSTMGRIVLSGASSAASAFLPFGSILTIPMQVAFYYWMRCSEFSADRAAVLCDGTADKMSTVCMYFAGYDNRIPMEPNKEEFMKQAQEYREIINNNGWDKTLEFMYMANNSHPLTAVRALECEEWAQTERCKNLLAGVPVVKKNPVPWYKDPELKEKNKEIAAQTIKICKEGCYTVNGKTISLPVCDFSATEIYTPEAGVYFVAKGIADYRKENMCRITVTTEDSLQAAHLYEKPFVMNFANAVHPGGGFLEGAPAQEESLCRNSTLYMSLTSKTAEPMYRFNKSGTKPMASDYMLLSPNVCVFRNEEGCAIANHFMVSVLTVPAPNRKKEAAEIDPGAIEETMKRRIRIMLHIAMQKGYQNLILGAWGCGAFGNDPTEVSEYFRSILIDEGYGACFSNICFAIYGPEDSPNYVAFAEKFGKEI